MRGIGVVVYRESLPDAPEGRTIRLCELGGIHLHRRTQCSCTCEQSRCVSHHRVTIVHALDAHDDHDLHWPSRSPDELTNMDMGIALTVGVCRRTLSNNEAKKDVLAASSSAGKNKKRRRSYICSFSPGWTKYSTLYSEARAAQGVESAADTIQVKTVTPCGEQKLNCTLSLKMPVTGKL